VVEAKPLAELDRSREVLLLWSQKPAAESDTPVEAKTTKPAVVKPAATTPAASAPAQKSTPADPPPPAPVREELLPEQPLPQATPDTDRPE
jgi:hypothetical protein